MKVYLIQRFRICCSLEKSIRLVTLILQKKKKSKNIDWKWREMTTCLTDEYWSYTTLLCDVFSVLPRKWNSMCLP